MDEITNKSSGGQFRGSQPQSIPVGGSQMGRRPVSGGGLRGRGAQVSQQGSSILQRKTSKKGSSGNFSMNRNQDSAEKVERTIRILDRVIAVCVFMLFFGLPLFFVNATYQGIVFEKQYYFYLWTFIGIVALVAQGMLGGKIEIRRTTLDIPLGVFWVATVISTLFSVDRYHSIFGFFGTPVSGLVSVTAIILAYYLIVSYISQERARMIMKAVVAAGSILVIWSFLVTSAIIPLKIAQVIPPSLTGSFTGLAIFLGMMIPILIMSLSLWGADGSGNIRSKVISFFLGLVLLIDLVTLSILYGYVQWFLIFLVVGVLLVFTVSNLVKVRQIIIVATGASFLILFGFWAWEQPVLKRTIQPEVSVSYPLSFSIAKEAIKDKAFFGSGPGTYGYNFSLHQPDTLNQSGQYDLRIYSDRGLFMESVSTLGILGMIALSVVVLTYISTAILSFIRSEDDEVKTISLGLFVASILALIHSLFVSGDGVIVLFGALLGAVTIGLLRGSLGEGMDQKLVFSMKASPQYALSFAFLSILVAVGVIFGFVTLGKMFIADVYAGDALRARAAGDFGKSTELFSKATALNKKEGRYYTVISQYALDLANIELSKSEEERNDEVVKNYIETATGTATIGRNLMPNDVLSNETQGFIYENSGGFVHGTLSVAMQAYERAGKLEPLNPYFDIALGKLKLVEAQLRKEDATDERVEDVRAAKEYFEAAKTKTTFDSQGQEVSLFAPAHYYISVTEEALDNKDEAINSMALALEAARYMRGSNQQQMLSRQINYGFNLARLLQVRGGEDDIKNAESLLLQILGVNDKEVNTHLSLGLLYERQGRKDEAVSEYKKIMEILPEEDEKARENIQGLIDTVESGGNNVEQGSQGSVEDTVEQSAELSSGEEDSQESDEPQPELKDNVLVVSGRDAKDRAEEGKGILESTGYEIDIREEDSEYENVVIMYGRDSREEAQSIEEKLGEKFEKIDIERNDEEIGKYNYEIVVIIGSEK